MPSGELGSDFSFFYVNTAQWCWQIYMLQHFNYRKGMRVVGRKRRRRKKFGKSNHGAVSKIHEISRLGQTNKRRLMNKWKLFFSSSSSNSSKLPIFVFELWKSKPNSYYAKMNKIFIAFSCRFCLSVISRRFWSGNFTLANFSNFLICFSYRSIRPDWCWACGC